MKYSFEQEISRVTKEYLDSKIHNKPYSYSLLKQNLSRIGIADENLQDTLLLIDDEVSVLEFENEVLKKSNIGLKTGYLIAILGLIGTIFSLILSHYKSTLGFIFYGAIISGFISVYVSKNDIQSIQNKRDRRKHILLKALKSDN